MVVVLSWLAAVLAGLALAVLATWGVVAAGTKNPPVGPTFVLYGTR